MKPWFTLVFFSVPLLLAQAPSDPALAVVEEAGHSELLRAGSPLELVLRNGDLLFAGDRVRSGTDGAVLWFCPALQVSRLSPRTEVSIEPAQLRVGTGAFQSQAPAPFCPTPGITRQTLLKTAFVGEAISRDRGSDVTVDEMAALTAAARSAFDADMQQIARSAISNSAIAAAARAAVYRRYGLHHAAANSFRELADQWNSIDWPRQLVHEEHEEIGRGEPAESALGGTGKTYALLAGISDYPLLKSDQRLQFADRDADLLFAYLRSPRGGAVPEENIRLLRNGRATLSAIRNGIAEFLRAKATNADTVILFIAAHGVASADGAYVLADDSDPDNLRDTGLNMIEIQDLLEGSLQHVGHVLIFVDVCRSGLIGNIATRNFSRLLQVLGRFNGGETFGLLASAPDEKSIEAERFGGGHGAFSYFLSRALNGDADADGDRRVTVNELQAYVYGMVRQATRNRQNPRVTGDMPGERVLIPDLSPNGIEIADWHAADVVAQSRAVPGGEPAQNFVRPQSGLEEQFEQALRAGRLLPPEQDNALDLLDLIRRTLPRGSLALLTIENRLRVALQNAGQQVLLKYLRGEEVPQQSEDFSAGAKLFSAALSLDSEAFGWQSREWFCEARAMLFENRFQEARQLLERAVRLEPEGPYLYNALGLLHLQQADFQTAASAFREAIRFAPYWSYPRHNLALTLTQAGDYDRAILAYKEAQRVAPQAWFVAYNLGLLYQRLQQFREAEKMFRTASRFSSTRPEPYTALGAIAASRGRRSDAEKFYREALAQQASFLPARHNLAVALDEGGRSAEAIQLWEEVLRADPRYLASRLALANALVQQKRYPEALNQYSTALAQDPESSRARLELARTFLLVGQPASAEGNARQILAGNSGTAAAWDLLGDSLAAQHRTADAVSAYQQALRLGGAEVRRQVSAKLKRIVRSAP